MDNNTNTPPSSSDQPDYNLYYSEFMPRKKKKSNNNMGCWLGLLGFGIFSLGLAVATIFFWVTTGTLPFLSATPTPIVQLQTATPSSTPQPIVTIAPTNTGTPEPSVSFLEPTLTPTPTQFFAENVSTVNPIPITDRIQNLHWTADNQLVAVKLSSVSIFTPLVPEAPARMLNVIANQNNVIVGSGLINNSQQVAIAYEQGTIQVWSIADQTLVGTWDTSYGNIIRMASSPISNQIALVQEDGTVSVWNSTGTESTRFILASDAIQVAFNSDGNRLIIGTTNGNLEEWDTAIGQPTKNIPNEQSSWVVALNYSSDNEMIASKADNGSVILIDLSSGEKIATLSARSANDVAFHPDNLSVATAEENGQARLWNIRDQQVVFTLDHNSPVTSVTFSPDGSFVVLGGHDDRISIWQTQSGQLTSELSY